MLQLSNPRREAVVEDWPNGRRRVNAFFSVETVKGKDRVCRTTTGKPKKTTYHVKMRLVDGDDGRIYALGLTELNQMVLWAGTLKTTEYFHEDDEEYGVYRALLEAAE